MRFLTNKLAIVVLLAGSVGGFAHASEVIVFEAPIDRWTQEVSPQFAVNRELGRAWVDVKLITESQGEEPPTEQVIMKTVDGLYYDSARKEVLYRTASGPIVCAEDATFLWRTYLKTTGQCRLNERTEHQKVDNGFDVREQTVAEVVFDTPSSAVSQRTDSKSTIDGMTGGN